MIDGPSEISEHLEQVEGQGQGQGYFQVFEEKKKALARVAWEILAMRPGKQIR